MRKFLGTALLLLLGAGTSGVAQAADMFSPLPVAGWDGFYAGGNIGYGSAIVDHVGSTIGDLTATGVLIGGQLGYNFSTGNNLVVGI